MNECAIVSDLLPLYKDSALSKTTQEFIEKHLKQCESCKKEMNTLFASKKIRTAPIHRNGDYSRLVMKIQRKRRVTSFCISLTFAITAGYALYKTLKL